MHGDRRLAFVRWLVGSRRIGLSTGEGDFVEGGEYVILHVRDFKFVHRCARV